MSTSKNKGILVEKGFLLMSRLFLSVLGLGRRIEGTSRYEYAECVYRSVSGETLPSTRYIQEASVRSFCRDWNFAQGDRVRILCTEQSFEHQWSGEGHLLECLNKLKSEPGYDNLDFSDSVLKMPEGKSKEEIWQIFNALFSCVSEGDEIWLDVTHGFRSIPMLVLTAVPYLRLLKKAEVKSITYGAYEAKDGGNVVPIFDLTDFVDLMDWTNAAKNFVDYGTFDDCKRLLSKANHGILKATQGKDIEAGLCRRISDDVDAFTQSIVQNNLEKSIVKGIPERVLENISKLGNSDLRVVPFKPVLDQIVSELSPFSRTSFGNIFHSVRWCIEHRFLQNGYSILLEGCISIALKKLELDGLVVEVSQNDENIRKIPINSCRMWIDERNQAKGATPQGVCMDGMEREWKIRKCLFDDDFSYAQTFEKLNKTRNAFMHCGTGGDKLPGGKGDLEKWLRECCEKMECWYKKLNIEKDN